MPTRPRIGFDLLVRAPCFGVDSDPGWGRDSLLLERSCSLYYITSSSLVLYLPIVKKRRMPKIDRVESIFSPFCTFPIQFSHPPIGDDSFLI